MFGFCLTRRRDSLVPGLDAATKRDVSQLEFLSVQASVSLGHVRIELTKTS